MATEQKSDNTQVNTGGGTYVADGVETQGDFIGRDSTVHGDQVRGHKIGTIAAGAQIAIGMQNTLTQQQPAFKPAPVVWHAIEQLLTELKRQLNGLPLSAQQTILIQYHIEQLQKTLLEIGGIPDVQGEISEAQRSVSSVPPHAPMPCADSLPSARSTGR